MKIFYAIGGVTIIIIIVRSCKNGEGKKEKNFEKRS